MLFSCSMVRSPSVRKLNCSENTVFATTTLGHRNTIPVLRSCLDTETVFQLVLKYLCPIGFDFNFKHAAFLCLELVLLQKNILGAYADIVPQTMASFHKSSQTRQQLWEGMYKVIFVMFLKKCLKITWEAQTEEIWESQHYTSQSSASSRNLMFHFSS